MELKEQIKDLRNTVEEFIVEAKNRGRNSY